MFKYLLVLLNLFHVSVDCLLRRRKKLNVRIQSLNFYSLKFIFNEVRNVPNIALKFWMQLGQGRQCTAGWQWSRSTTMLAWLLTCSVLPALLLPARLYGVSTGPGVLAQVRRILA